MLDFVECFFCISWDNYICGAFCLHSIHVVHYVAWFSNVEPFSSPRINLTWLCSSREVWFQRPLLLHVIRSVKWQELMVRGSDFSEAKLGSGTPTVHREQAESGWSSVPLPLSVTQTSQHHGHLLLGRTGKSCQCWWEGGQLHMIHFRREM